MTRLNGTFTALITPFTADGTTVDVARLRANVTTQSIAGVRGVVPCGTTGETPTLSEREHLVVVEETIAAAHPAGLVVMAGAGANDTTRAVRMHRIVADLGADAALHVTPYYNRPSQEGLYRHYASIADASDLPVVLYNVPGRTGVTLASETVVRLASHPNIRGLKDATGDLVNAAAIAAETDLDVLSGDDPLTPAFLSVGAVGVVSVLSNVLPSRVVAMVAAFLDGDVAAALTQYRSTLPLARALLSLDSNPVPVKAALALLGRDTGVVRPPLCPPPDEVVATLRALVTGEVNQADTRVAVEVAPR
ncbi:MAG: 4-hydroxy-tetrahydrodipicolinate synthase [Phycisphaerae bacterium]|nr:4-hydroxy-tetrahydrodipicolinate synthase [Phycisphaerae bacterium]